MCLWRISSHVTIGFDSENNLNNFFKQLKSLCTVKTAQGQAVTSAASLIS